MSNEIPKHRKTQRPTGWFAQWYTKEGSVRVFFGNNGICDLLVNAIRTRAQTENALRVLGFTATRWCTADWGYESALQFRARQGEGNK